MCCRLLSFYRAPNSVNTFDKQTGVEFLRTADVHLFEMNEIVKSLPPDLKFGTGMWEYCKNRTFGRIVEKHHATQVFVFVADNYELVPAEKAATHKKRAASCPDGSMLSDAHLAEIEITDGPIPTPTVIKSNAALMYKAIVSLYSQIIRFRSLFGDNAQISLSYPSPKRSCSGLTWPSTHSSYGENVCITGGPEPPLHWTQGEGEIVVRLWVGWLKTTFPTVRRFVATSCDNDNYVISLLRPAAESEGLYIHMRDVIKPGTDTVQMMRILDCHALCMSFPSAEIRASVAVVAILCGSDYCTGYDRVGPLTLLKQALPSPSDDAAPRLRAPKVKKPQPKITSIYEEPLFVGSTDVIPDRMQRFVDGLFKKAERRPKIDSCPVFQSAMMNVRYWALY